MDEASSFDGVEVCEFAAEDQRNDSHNFHQDV
jgi:hypothetical protein